MPGGDVQREKKNFDQPKEYLVMMMANDEVTTMMKIVLMLMMKI